MNFETSLVSISYIDILSNQTTSIHKLDARIKLITTFLFCGVVLSISPYEVSALIPFFIYPVFVLSAGRIPILFIIKKMLLVFPFALMIASFALCEKL